MKKSSPSNFLRNYFFLKSLLDSVLCWWAVEELWMGAQLPDVVADVLQHLIEQQLSRYYIFILIKPTTVEQFVNSITQILEGQ